MRNEERSNSCYGTNGSQGCELDLERVLHMRKMGANAALTWAYLPRKTKKELPYTVGIIISEELQLNVLSVYGLP